MHHPTFYEEQYTVKAARLGETTVRYRAFENLQYTAHPVSPIQTMHIYAPEAFYSGAEINGYQLRSAPIFFPNTVGGYMPGPAAEATSTVILEALAHGYVVACPGVRGSGMQDSAGKQIGTAPAAICDLKAAVRYLRFHASKLPGNCEKIVSNGTSAGGALSALLGASGNHADYEASLAELGAAEEQDHIFAASCYCPITDLEHADMAYEWEFSGIADDRQAEEQMKLSKTLKQMFPAYVQSLELTDGNGTPLLLQQGGGSFETYITDAVVASAQKALDGGADLSALPFLHIDQGRVRQVDFKGFAAYRTRMKATPAFDHLGLCSLENALFGSPDTERRHFTHVSHAASEVQGAMADSLQIKMMNPMHYIGSADTAPYFRIRHGTADRDTSMAVSAVLTAKLRMHGCTVDWFYPWGIPHSGDYDLPELFHWIDSLCNPK